jgi:hypothetical protein
MRGCIHFIVRFERLFCFNAQKYRNASDFLMRAGHACTQKLCLEFFLNRKFLIIKYSGTYASLKLTQISRGTESRESKESKRHCRAFS